MAPSNDQAGNDQAGNEPAENDPVGDRAAKAAAFRRFERQLRLKLDARVAALRVWESLPAILQITVAVAAAYSIARYGLGHSIPILAVTVTINSLGFSRDARPSRVATTVIGILVGVGLSEAMSLVIGRGPWQLVVVLLVVFVVGRAVSANPAFAIAAAVPSALVVILPISEGGPFGRTLDAAIGGAIALIVTALIPRDPARAAARERRRLFAAIDDALGSVIECLNDADDGAGELGLTRLRRTQTLVDNWSTGLETAIAVARISPFLRARLPQLQKEARVLAATDLTTRHLRTLARRIEFLVRDGVPRPALAELISQFAIVIKLLGDELDDPQLAGAARSLLTDLARRLDPAIIMPDAQLTDAATVLLLRPLAVDLLVGTGMPIDDARAVLPKL